TMCSPQHARHKSHAHITLQLRPLYFRRGEGSSWLQLELPVTPQDFNPKRQMTAALQEPGGNACGLRTSASVLECGCPLPLSVLSFVDLRFQSRPLSLLACIGLPGLLGCRASLRW